MVNSVVKQHKGGLTAGKVGNLVSGMCASCTEGRSTLPRLPLHLEGRVIVCHHQSPAAASSHPIPNGEGSAGLPLLQV